MNKDEKRTKSRFMLACIHIFIRMDTVCIRWLHIHMYILNYMQYWVKKKWSRVTTIYWILHVFSKSQFHWIVIHCSLTHPPTYLNAILHFIVLCCILYVYFHPYFNQIGLILALHSLVHSQHPFNPFYVFHFMHDVEWTWVVEFIDDSFIS